MRVVLGVLYTFTPATALGLKNDPSLAHANTRYAVPALIVAVPLVAWAAGRLPRIAGLVLEGALAVAALLGAYHGYEVARAPATSCCAGAGLAALGAAALVLWRLRERRVVLVAAAIAAALVGLAAAHRVEDRINAGRYRGVDPAIDTLLQAAPSGHRIGLASDWSVGGLAPVWPAFGTRIGNEVEFVGHFVRGFMTPYRSAAEFQAALRRGRFDLLVVGRGFYPPQATPEQRWAIDAGWRTIALSRRLRVLAAPADQAPMSRLHAPRLAQRLDRSAAIRPVSASTSAFARTQARACSPARSRCTGPSASAARSCSASAAASPGGARKPHGARTHSGRPTSSLATTSSRIAIASLTTTGIESRSPSAATTQGIASTSADSSAARTSAGGRLPSMSTATPRRRACCAQRVAQRARRRGSSASRRAPAQRRRSARRSPSSRRAGRRRARCDPAGAACGARTPARRRPSRSCARSRRGAVLRR